MKSQDIRWIQRFQNFRKAFQQLSSAVALSRERLLSDLERLGLIHVFEFTHELAWNTLKDFLESRGTTNLFGSKDTTREAFTNGLVEHGEVWMEMIQSRNKSTHAYDCKAAEAISNEIKSSYLQEFDKFQKKFAELEE